MRSFLAALSMLSILPVGRFLPTEKDLRNMVNCYPAVGLLFAFLFWGIGLLLSPLPPPIGAMLLTLLPEVLTKGFHLDGLADTADGMLSGRPREQKLEIMRDSRIGTMGVFAIVAILGTKFALFASLPSGLWPATAALMMLSGRCGIVWYIALSKYARQTGLGKLSFGVRPYFGLCCSMGFPVVAGYWLLDGAGALLIFLPTVAMIGWSAWTRHVLGGATGDTIGAAEEFGEVLIPAEILCFYLLKTGKF